MKALILALIGGLVAPLAQESYAQEQTQTDASYKTQQLAFFPSTPFRAALMRLAFDKSASEISARFNEAITESPEWFQSYLADNANIKPLPYHKNFGISEDEYKQMLKSFDSKHLEKIQDVSVLVARTPDGLLRIECPELGKSFPGITVDTKSGKLTTPIMEVEKPDAKNSGLASDGNPFGDWTGVSWKKAQSDSGKGDFRSLSLIIGRSKSQGVSFIAYRIKAMVENKIKSNFESILQFETPAQ